MGLSIDVLREFPPKNSHKFYLHFNSDPCEVDPQVWTRGINSGAVPVVFGVDEALLRDSLPRGSYVSADHFTSAAELAEYLVYLDRDHEAYRYFPFREKVYNKIYTRVYQTYLRNPLTF